MVDVEEIVEELDDVTPSFDEMNKNIFNDDEANTFLQLLSSDHSQFAQAAAALYFRRLYSADNSKEKAQQTEDFYRKVITRLLTVLASTKSACDTRLDCSWAITNLCCISKEVNHLIVELGGIDQLLKGARTGNREIQLQCIWALGNIAADCSDCKMKCRETDLLKVLAILLCGNVYTIDKQVKSIVWCVLNLVRGGIQNVDILHIRYIVSSCFRTMKRFPNKKDLMKDCVWILAALADDVMHGHQVEAILNEPGLIAYIIVLLDKKEYEYVHHGCLRLLGNIVTGTDEQTDRIISHAPFQHILMRSFNEHGSLQREAAWISSNIAAGTINHIEYLFESPLFFPAILKGIHEGEKKMVKECLWTVANLLAGSMDERIENMVAAGALEVFSFLLKSDDRRLVERALGGLKHIVELMPAQAALIRQSQLTKIIPVSMLEQNPQMAWLMTQTERLLEDSLPNTEPFTYHFTS